MKNIQKEKGVHRTQFLLQLYWIIIIIITINDNEGNDKDMRRCYFATIGDLFMKYHKIEGKRNLRTGFFRLGSVNVYAHIFCHEFITNIYIYRFISDINLFYTDTFHVLISFTLYQQTISTHFVWKSCLTSPTQQVTSRFTDSLKRAPFYISNEQLNKRWGSDLHFVTYWRCVFMSFNLIALQKQFREVFLCNGCVVVRRIEIPRMPKYKLKTILWTHIT